MDTASGGKRKHSSSAETPSDKRGETQQPQDTVMTIWHRDWYHIDPQSAQCVAMRAMDCT